MKKYNMLHMITFQFTRETKIVDKETFLESNEKQIKKFVNYKIQQPLL